MANGKDSDPIDAAAVSAGVDDAAVAAAADDKTSTPPAKKDDDDVETNAVDTDKDKEGKDEINTSESPEGSNSNEGTAKASGDSSISNAQTKPDGKEDDLQQQSKENPIDGSAKQPESSSEVPPVQPKAVVSSSNEPDLPPSADDDGVTDTAVMEMKNQSEEAIIQGALNLGDDVKIPSHQSSEELAEISQGKNGKAFFPMKLFDIVSDEANENIIKWLPGGKAFIIVDKKRFANEVLPKHFQQSQFTSFTRKLSRWRFTRVPRGPFIGAYYNKLFLKGHRSLCWHMRCKNENIGKTKFERKMDVSLAAANTNLDATSNPPTPLAAIPQLQQQYPPNGTMMHGIPPHMPMQGIQNMQGYQMPAMAAMPGQPYQPLPGQPPNMQNMQAGANPGLNNQILAMEGRLRELQNVHPGIDQHQQSAFMYGNQMMVLPNNMVPYGTPQYIGTPPGAAPQPQAQQQYVPQQQPMQVGVVLPPGAVMAGAPPGQMATGAPTPATMQHQP